MRAWQANLAGVGIAGLVLGAGLVVTAPDAVANGPTSPRTLGAPQSLDNAQGEIPVGDSIQLAGRPSKLKLFWTSDAPEKVVRSYGEAWDKAGMIVHYERLDRVTSVSAVEASTGLMRVVTVIDEGDQRMVLPNITDIRVPPNTSPEGAPLPLPEGTTAYMSHIADDATSVNYHATYRVPATSKQMMAFYETELGKSGYAVSEAKKNLKGGASLEFTRGVEWISVVASDEPQMEGVGGEPVDSSVVILSHVRSIAGPAGATP